MAEETATETPAPTGNGETEKSDEPPKPGPVPGTKEFNEKIAAGEVVHAPDPTGKSPGQVQQEEREKDEDDKSKK